MSYLLSPHAVNRGLAQITEYPDTEHPLSSSFSATQPFVVRNQYLRLMGSHFLLDGETLTSGTGWQGWVQDKIEDTLRQIAQRGIFTEEPSISAKSVDYGGGRFGGVEVSIEVMVAPKMARDIFTSIHADVYEKKPWQDRLAGLQARRDRIAAVIIADAQHQAEDSRETFNTLMDARDRLRSEEWEAVVQIGERYVNYLNGQNDEASRKRFLERIHGLSEMEQQ